MSQVGADPTIPEGNGFTDRRVCRFSVLTQNSNLIIHNQYILYFWTMWESNPLVSVQARNVKPSHRTAHKLVFSFNISLSTLKLKS